MIAVLFADPSLEAWLKANPRWPGFLLALVCILLLLPMVLPRLASWHRGRKRPVLEPVQVEELLLGPGALVVDLRSPAEYRSGHIRGSLHVPFPELAHRFSAPDTKAKRAMILVDETDALAHQAYDLLTRRGFDWLYVLKGGMRAWRRANRPVAR